MGSLHSLLIVDDERVIREGLSTMVNWEQLGFELAAIVADGREALRYLDEHVVDAILTDIRMTFVSGLDLARTVREQHPNTKVVLLSGHREFELAQQAVSAGVHDYLLKPVDFAQLRRVFSGLAEQIDEEKRELAARASEESARRNERLMLLAQFYERVLADRSLEPGAINALWHQIGPRGALAHRPFALIAQRAIAGQSVGIREIAALLDRGSDEIGYVALFEGSPGQVDSQRIAAHACRHIDPEQFLSLLQHDIAEVADGLRTMFGTAVSLEVVECYDDLPDAANRFAPEAGGHRAEGRLENDERGGSSCATSVGHHPLVERAKRFLIDHYANSIGLAETADALGVSPAYLSRVFSEYAGTTLIEFLTKYRVERACALLIGTSLPVEEIAGSVGYASSSHFARVFKRHTGVSAGSYRTENQRLRR